jgi:hypothetical protein
MFSQLPVKRLRERTMDEKDLKAEARLWALEIMVCRLYAMQFRLMGVAGPSIYEACNDQKIGASN